MENSAKEAKVLNQPSRRTKKERKAYAEPKTLYEANGVSKSKRLKEQSKESELEINLGKSNFENGSNIGRRMPAPKFRKMHIVEVSSDEEGYENAWYAAMIVKCLENDKYLVEYFTLKEDDNITPLKEEAFASFIRPFPPCTRSDDDFKQYEEVDAWYNDGWWSGMISKVLDGNKYLVYFDTKEELTFYHCDLRPQLNWVNGQWLNVSKIPLSHPSWKTEKVKAKRPTSKKPGLS